jgi:hypothetical protein
MAYQLEINNKQAYEWLKKLVNNTLESPSSRPYQTSYEELMCWKEAFDRCDQQREEAAAARRQQAPTKSVAKKSSHTRRQTRKEISEFDCLEHPKYGGVRMPRTDCKKCWSIFKKLHPMEYDRARRRFNLKQKQKA